MGKRFESLSSEHIEFIQKQHMFFVATATAESKINLSPKGLDSFRIVDGNRVIWLNLTGSGNETAAHLLKDKRMTIMFCAFEGSALILRLYGKAQAYHEDSPGWKEYVNRFPPMAGTRQIVEMEIDMVQTSCGFGVPIMEFKENRETLIPWAEKKGEDGLKNYWKDRNSLSIDGLPTGISTKE